MNDALKRIEERHCPTDMGTCSECPRGTEVPCDVVKLAQALEIARLAFVSIGAIADAKYAERTLEDVAGEER